MPRLNPISTYELPEEYQEELNNSWHDKLSAGMELQNPLSRYMGPDYVPSQDFPAEEGYDPYDDPKIQGYNPEAFLVSKSPQETRHIAQEIDANRRLIQRAGGAPGLMGEISGAVFNPILLAPAFASGGMSIPALVALEMGAEGINETILHAQQPLRTSLESAVNIASVGILSTVGLRLSRGRMGIPGRVDPDMGRPAPDVAPVGFEPVSGAHVPGWGIRLPDVLSGPSEGKAVVEGMEEFAGELAPIGPVKARILFKASASGDILAYSESQTAKQAVQNLVEVPYRFEEGKAVPQSVETKVKGSDGQWADMMHYFDDEYAKYRQKGGKLSIDEFDTQVAIAMRNGDVHEVSQIQAVARNFRKYDDGYMKQANDLGLYGSDGPTIKGAKSHLMRIYDRKAIIKGFDHFRRVLSGKIAKGLGRNKDYVLVRYFDDEVGDDVVAYVHSSKLQDIEKAHADTRIVAGDEIAKLSPEAVVEAADKAAVSTINRLLSSDPVDISTLDYIVPKAGAIHERTLTAMNDTELEPFLKNSARDVMHVTSKQMTREIEMTRTFGTSDMKEVISKISDEYNDLIAAAKTEKQRAKLVSRRKKDITRIQAMRDLVLGTYGAPKDPTAALVRMGRGLRVLSMLSHGANITSSSLSDLAAPALRHGLTPFRHGLRVLFSGVTKDQVKFANRIGIGIESLTAARAQAFSEMAFVDKFSHQSMRAFGKWTGLNTFTDISQSLNAVATSEMWSKWLRQYDTLSAKKKQKLMDVGIDEKFARSIVEQMREFGTTKNGVMIPNTTLWKDIDAAKRFENALRKEVNLTTIIPGKGDLPLWMKTETGKFFGQFMSFMMSSTQRWLLAGMQRADVEFLQGFMAIAVAGGLVEYGKGVARGKDMSHVDPIDLVMGGLDRGGNLGFFSIPVNWAKTIESGQSNRRVSRGMVEEFLVPSGAMYAQQVLNPVVKVAQGKDLTDDDIWGVIKAVPLANSFHAIDLLKQVAE